MSAETQMILRSGALQAAKATRCLVLDVDGVCTDGQLYYFADGQIAKSFSCQDGLGIKTALKSGLEIGVISGRADPATLHRMRDLGVRHVYLGNSAKLEALEAIRAELGLDYTQMAFLGDDYIDLDPMRKVGLPSAVRNARAKIQDQALLVTAAKGGQGAVRELIDFILEVRNPDFDPSSLWTEQADS